MLIFGVIDPKDTEKMSARKERESEELSRLKQENKELRRQLAQERMKAEAYDTMIDVAEEMFKIPVRKKPGTKQS